MNRIRRKIIKLSLKITKKQKFSKQNSALIHDFKKNTQQIRKRRKSNKGTISNNNNKKLTANTII